MKNKIKRIITNTAQSDALPAELQPQTYEFIVRIWCSVQGSNLQLLPCRDSTLPIELTEHNGVELGARTLTSYDH